MQSVILRLLVIVAAISPGLSNDDEFPASCAMRPICTDYRTRTPTPEETYQVATAEVIHGILQVALRNEAGNNLTLIVRGVENNTFRVIIEEPDEHRYHLEYSLEKEPTLMPLNMTFKNETSLTASDSMGISTVTVLWDPLLQIQFYHNDILETVVDGNRLIMENTKESQAFTFAIKFNEVKRLIGLHERVSVVGLFHTADLKLDPYRFKNVDYAYQRMNSTKPMYGAVPLIYGLGNDHVSGVFLNNAGEMWIDINTTDQSAYFMVYSGVLDLFIFTGPRLVDAVRQYTNLTGKPHLPQLWALGHHQSRYGYKTEEDVRGIVENFDKYNIPVDSVWLDLDYTVGCMYFTWNKTEFPDPVGLLDWVDSQAGRKMVVISDPHIKVDEDYEIFKNCKENNYFVNNKDGSNFVGTCWPGDSSWVDFLNPEARDYYASLHSYDVFPSTSALGGFWNDMNEPAAFNDDEEKSIPYDTLHYGNVTHGEVHNIYGMLQVMATHQGLMERDEGQIRPFILSRSIFAGAQRYTAKWAGDTGGGYSYQRMIVPMTINSNLAGFVFYGGDIPGFGGDPTEDLVTRWYQIGAWIPFFRAHGDKGTLPREPWTFSNETRELIHQSIEMRYRHIPYWYTLFYEHVRTGDPIVRPLFYHYPNDDETLDINDEFLVGTNILVANVYFENATSLRVYLPGKYDSWFQITGDSHKIYQGGEWYTIPVDISFIPVFYKSGSIICTKAKVGRSTTELKLEPYELQVVVDQDEYAKGRLYHDDFQTFEYLNKKYVYLDITYGKGTFNATLVDTDVDPSEFVFIVNSATLYINNGNGTYSIKRLDEINVGYTGLRH
ncbi:neutral alpha-glucosidase C-like [Euwallacea fornicatus]|uniref:neutral alpha-glucosidase C-like n=1 Tax=Euwallacea fornicatus TaxID=995702 RepID=UPI00338D481B